MLDTYSNYISCFADVSINAESYIAITVYHNARKSTEASKDNGAIRRTLAGIASCACLGALANFKPDHPHALLLQIAADARHNHVQVHIVLPFADVSLQFRSQDRWLYREQLQKASLSHSIISQAFKEVQAWALSSGCTVCITIVGCSCLVGTIL